MHRLKSSFALGIFLFRKDFWAPALPEPFRNLNLIDGAPGSPPLVPLPAVAGAAGCDPWRELNEFND